ncbi:ubiquinone/menaquinone biosynthesis methyltransferase [Leifsonia shinshuensis]|uniref:Demethylmenaquinone methyltransferase n=1 Tax=Leifsonia shinshuensis TaxID=150026 RepID=A0A853D4D3_9MICO|nr:demethylmenaquinone methyltransferase/2-methoxy-6-polyprenyl-1,4-benzoquinol methylase [Leifsonia shinshuensis]
MSKADLSKQPAQVAAMFDEVSTHYDRTNTVLSMGNATLWRVATTRAVAPRAGETILDVAAGTGTSSASLARNGASVVAADFSEGMIEVGRRRQAGNPFISFVQADATALPFDDDTFDAVTISFGLRNIVDPRAALAEFYRVTKPGGRVVVCEFSQPPLAPVRAGYGAYLRYGMPVLARLASSNPAAYEYLMESIEAWPNQPALASWLRETGFERVAWRNLTAGIVALHRGWKPVEATGGAHAGAEAEAKPAARKSTAAKAAGSPAARSNAGATKATGGKPADVDAGAEAANLEVVATGAAKSAAATVAAAKPAGAKPAAPKASAAKSAAPKASAAKSASAKPEASKPAAAKSEAAAPAATKALAAKPASVKPAAATAPASKAGAAKAGTAKPGTAKPGAAKPGPAKPGAAKPGPAKPASAKAPASSKPASAKVPASSKPASAKAPASAKPAPAKAPAAKPAAAKPASADPASGSAASARSGRPAGSEDSTSAVPPEGE